MIKIVCIFATNRSYTKIQWRGIQYITFGSITGIHCRQLMRARSKRTYQIEVYIKNSSIGIILLISKTFGNFLYQMKPNDPRFFQTKVRNVIEIGGNLQSKLN